MIVAVEALMEGVTVGEETVSGLTFANNFVAISRTPEGLQKQIEKALLWGTIIIRTCDQHKNLYNPLFLLAICGPDYYVPR